MSKLSTTFNDADLRNNFRTEAAYINSLHNMFYLAAYSDDLKSLFRDSMRAASSAEAKRDMANTLADVIEIIGMGSRDSRGVSNTLSTMAETSAIEKLSSALLKHIRASELPADFAQKMTELSSGLAQSASRQPSMVAEVLRSKAKALARASEKTIKLTSPPPERKSFLSGLLPFQRL